MTATLLCGAAPTADGDAGGLALPAACARVEAASLAPSTGVNTGFDAVRLAVRLPPAPGARKATPSLSASEMQVRGEGAPVSEQALERAASVSTASLLIALAGHGFTGCPDRLLQEAGKPLADALGVGGAYAATWRNLVLRGSAGQVTARLLRLRLESGQDRREEASGRPVHVTLTMDGIEGKLAPPTLLPEQLSLRVTLPASSLPALLAVTGGGAPDIQVPVTIDALDVRRGKTTLLGTGEGAVGATPLDSRVQLHVTAQNFAGLVQEAAVRDLVRLHTALLLAELMAHRSPAGFEWDVGFEDGLATVNRLPIPWRTQPAGGP